MGSWACRASRAGDEVYVRARDMAECRVLCYGVTTSARAGEQASTCARVYLCQRPVPGLAAGSLFVSAK